jgi:hypothetical protein
MRPVFLALTSFLTFAPGGMAQDAAAYNFARQALAECQSGNPAVCRAYQDCSRGIEHACGALIARYYRGAAPGYRAPPPAYAHRYDPSDARVMTRRSVDDQNRKYLARIQCEKGCEVGGNAYATGGLARISACKARC